MSWLSTPLVPLGVACVTATLACAQGTGRDGAPDDAADTASETAAPTRGGKRLYVDPATGERTTPPADHPDEPVPPALDTSSQGLVERPLPGGGYAVDLQGRFQQRREGQAPEPAGDAPAPGAPRPAPTR